MTQRTRYTATLLTTSRHGIYCLRLPIPRNSNDYPRRFVQLSLGTRDPKEAELLSRALQVETEAFTELMKQQVKDDDGTVLSHADLKARIESHYRSALEKAKTRRNVLGPSDEYHDSIRQTIDLLSMPNRDYWSLLGKENARASLNDLCEAIGIQMPSEPGSAMALLDHIREVQKAAAQAALEHSEGLQSWDDRNLRSSIPQAVFFAVSAWPWTTGTSQTDQK